LNPPAEVMRWKPQGPACRQNKALLELFHIFNGDAILARSEADVLCSFWNGCMTSFTLMQVHVQFHTINHQLKLISPNLGAFHVK